MDCDLAIIGAGPAGMAAAATAHRAGLSVTLLDEQRRLGGQIYRDIERTTKERAMVLGADYLAGRGLVDALHEAGGSYVPNATVWQADPDGGISYSVEGAAKRLTAGRILIATGALERPVPVPGWTLPGVMTAGAGQILLKQSGVLAKRAVIAGSGPLIYLIAAQMVRAGTPPLALVETQTPRDFLLAQKHLFGALRGWRYLKKGLGLIAELRRAGVQRYRGASGLMVKGQGRAEALHFECAGRAMEIECDTVFLHMGVVPNTQLSRAMGLAHDWHSDQRCYCPVTDDWGRTSAPQVFVAGDGAGISGATAAEYAGQVAALKIAEDLGHLTPTALSEHGRPIVKALARERAIRPFLDLAYPPAREVLTPSNGTIVCRCEEVTAGDIRRFAAMGCDGPNQTKAFSRAGMGPCQGRYCGLTVSTLLANANGRTVAETGYYRIRPPIKPLTLGELAQLEDTGGGGKEGMDLG
ncbi:MAG: NAD(P)/FAD-dependent oxidoreductase [Epibacterium sp.]